MPGSFKLFGGKNSSLVSVLALPLGVLDVPVDTTDAFSVGNLYFDEAIIAPMPAPRVLNDPVGNAFIFLALLGNLLLAAHPPLVHSAFFGGWIEVTVLIVIALATQLIANDCNCMIQLLAASIGLLHDAAAISAQIAGADGGI